MLKARIISVSLISLLIAMSSFMLADAIQPEIGDIYESPDLTINAGYPIESNNSIISWSSTETTWYIAFDYPGFTKVRVYTWDIDAVADYRINNGSWDDFDGFSEQDLGPGGWDYYNTIGSLSSGDYIEIKINSGLYEGSGNHYLGSTYYYYLKVADAPPSPSLNDDIDFHYPEADDNYTSYDSYWIYFHGTGSLLVDDCLDVDFYWYWQSNTTAHHFTTGDETEYVIGGGGTTYSFAKEYVMPVVTGSHVCRLSVNIKIITYCMLDDSQQPVPLLTNVWGYSDSFTLSEPNPDLNDDLYIWMSSPEANYSSGEWYGIVFNGTGFDLYNGCLDIDVYWYWQSNHTTQHFTTSHETLYVISESRDEYIWDYNANMPFVAHTQVCRILVNVQLSGTYYLCSDDNRDVMVSSVWCQSNDFTINSELNADLNDDIEFQEPDPDDNFTNNQPYWIAFNGTGTDLAISVLNVDIWMYWQSNGSQSHFYNGSDDIYVEDHGDYWEFVYVSEDPFFMTNVSTEEVIRFVVRVQIIEEFFVLSDKKIAPFSQSVWGVSSPATINPPLWVIDTIPQYDEENVSILLPNVTINFNKELNPMQYEGTFEISPFIDGELTISNDNKSLIYVLSETLANLQIYTVTISGDLHDWQNELLDGDYDNESEGSPEDDYVFMFRTYPETPVVMDTNPYNGKKNVYINVDIEFVFSRAMDEDTVEGNFTIYPLINGTFVWSLDHKNLTYVKDNDFDYYTRYYCNITGDAKDIEGYYLDGNGDGVSEGSPDDDYTLTFITRPEEIPEGEEENGIYIEVVGAGQWSVDNTNPVQEYVGSQINVIADIESDGVIKDAELNYYFLPNGTSDYTYAINYNTVKMVKIQGNLNKGLWQAEIPEQEQSGTIFFYITTQTYSGNYADSDVGQIHIVETQAQAGTNLIELLMTYWTYLIILFIVIFAIFIYLSRNQ